MYVCALPDIFGQIRCRVEITRTSVGYGKSMFVPNNNVPESDTVNLDRRSRGLEVLWYKEVK